jgi:hypothetical protein
MVAVQEKASPRMRGGDNRSTVDDDGDQAALLKAVFTLACSG